MPDIIEKSLAVTQDTEFKRGLRRSERVALKIPLKLTARMPDSRQICIEVQTQVVNAHGGLLDMGLEMEPDQRILLNNDHSEELVPATILRIEKSEMGRFSVAFAFDYPVDNFWPVTFPPDTDLSRMD